MYGNSYKSFLLAVVVPNYQFLAKLPIFPPKEATQGGQPEDAPKRMLKAFEGDHKAELKAAVLQSLRSVEKELKGFETVRLLP